MGFLEVGGNLSTFSARERSVCERSAGRTGMALCHGSRGQLPSEKPASSSFTEASEEQTMKGRPFAAVRRSPEERRTATRRTLCN